MVRAKVSDFLNLALGCCMLETGEERVTAVVGAPPHLPELQKLDLLPGILAATLVGGLQVYLLGSSGGSHLGEQS